MARILHIHESWSGTAAARRARMVAEGLGSSLRHDVVLVGGIGAAQPPRAPFRLLRDFPKLSGIPTLGKLQKIAKAMLEYDLVCTYGYGAINAAMAHTAFSEAFTLPALIHHEDEKAQRGMRADFYRRLAFGRSAGLVVPDERIEEAALTAWQQPMGRVKLIPEGIDLKPWRRPPPSDLLRGVVKRPGEKWIGAVYGDWPAGSLTNILEACAPLTENWQLVILGAEDDAEAIRVASEEMDIAHRVHLADYDPDNRALGLCDITLVPAGVEESNLAAIRAIAGGSVLVADPASLAAPLVPETAEEFVVPFANADDLAFAVGTLAADEGLRENLGEAARALAKSAHDEKAMIATYKRLYVSAMKLAGLP